MSPSACKQRPVVPGHVLSTHGHGETQLTERGVDLNVWRDKRRPFEWATVKKGPG